MDIYSEAYINGLTLIVHQPIRGSSKLDRIYVSEPLYCTVRAVTSMVRSDHLAVVAYSDTTQGSVRKAKTQRKYRPVTVKQHAQFLHYLTTTDAHFHHSEMVNVQSAFDSVYTDALELLNMFYPERVITVSSRDPAFMTPSIKAMLRRKYKLNRSGRVEEANALAKRIGRCIASQNMKWLKRDNRNIEAKDIWQAVRQVTGRNRESAVHVDGVDAESLNKHYASIIYRPRLPSS